MGQDQTQREAVVIMCGPLTGISGGDVHALRLVQEWTGRRPGSALLMAPPSMLGSIPARIAPSDIQLVRTPIDRWLRGLVSYAAVVTLRSFVAAVRAPRARVVIAASQFMQDALPLAVHRLRYRSRPVVFVYHVVGDMERARDLRSLVSVSAERLSLGLLRISGAEVFADNEETMAALERRGFDRSRLHLTGNAYDPVEPLPARNAPERPHVVSLGRLKEEKGAWDMVELARVLAERAPEARVTMLGEGPLQDELLARIRSLGLDNIELRGFVSEEEKWRTLRGATLLVAPSREEGWGIAVGEALLCELPVVAYDLPAYGHLGDLPLKVKTGDVTTLVETAVRLLTDDARLTEEQQRVSRGAETLPRWSDVLGAEIALLDAYPAAPR